MVDAEHPTLYVDSIDWALLTHTITKYFVCVHVTLTLFQGHDSLNLATIQV